MIIQEVVGQVNEVKLKTVIEGTSSSIDFSGSLMLRGGMKYSRCSLKCGGHRLFSSKVFFLESVSLLRRVKVTMRQGMEKRVGRGAALQW